MDVGNNVFFDDVVVAVDNVVVINDVAVLLIMKQDFSRAIHI